MSNNENMASMTNLKQDEGTFSLVDFIAVLVKNRKLIFGVPLLVAVAAAAISFVLPNVYRASAKLLPPQQAQSSAASLLSQLGGVAGAAAGAAGLKSPNDLYIGMLKSRTIADKLIVQFKLQKVYELESLEKTRKMLEERTAIAAGKDGLIAIEVEDENKKLAAQLANAYVQELINLTQTLAVTEASQRRLFYERQLEAAKNKLATAEHRLKTAMDSTGMISVDADSRAIVETIGRLRAQVSAKEIELNSMRAFVTVNNAAFRRVQEELNSLRSELARLENGRTDGKPSTGDGEKRVGLESIALLRDVKYHQMLYELLAKQYEVARLDEAKDASVIQVLDPAIEPEHKFKPKRALLVVLSATVALFFTVIWCFIREAMRRILTGNTVAAAQWAELRANVGNARK